MTTSTATPASTGLGDLLARHLRSIVRIDAVVTTLAALEMIVAPAFFVNMHGLGSTPHWAARAMGVEWLLFGLWLFSLWNSPLTRGKAQLAIAVLGGNVLFVLAAPLVFGLGFSAMGWAFTLGTVFFMELVIYAWWQVLNGRSEEVAIDS